MRDCGLWTPCQLRSSFIAFPRRILCVITAFSIGDGLECVRGILGRVEGTDAVMAPTTCKRFDCVMLDAEPEGSLKVLRSHFVSLIRCHAQDRRADNAWVQLPRQKLQKAEVRDCELRPLRRASFTLCDMCILSREGATATCDHNGTHQHRDQRKLECGSDVRAGECERVVEGLRSQG